MKEACPIAAISDCACRLGERVAVLDSDKIDAVPAIPLQAEVGRSGSTPGSDRHRFPGPLNAPVA
jgi:hypothetical protein